jgi:hypothetical protein
MALRARNLPSGWFMPVRRAPVYLIGTRAIRGGWITDNTGEPRRAACSKSGVASAATKKREVYLPALGLFLMLNVRFAGSCREVKVSAQYANELRLPRSQAMFGMPPFVPGCQL